MSNLDYKGTENEHNCIRRKKKKDEGNSLSPMQVSANHRPRLHPSHVREIG